MHYTLVFAVNGFKSDLVCAVLSSVKEIDMQRGKHFHALRFALLDQTIIRR